MGRVKIKISPAQVKAIQEGRIRGVDLAKKLGISLMGMWQALRKRYGYKSRRPWGMAKMSKQDIADYKAGKITRKKLAEKLNCSEPTIQNRLVSLNSISKRGEILKARVALERKNRQKEFAALFKSGKSLKDIADKEGLSRQRISQIMAGMFGSRISGWRPVWCVKCKKEMLASRMLKVICPQCADLKKVKA